MKLNKLFYLVLFVGVVVESLALPDAGLAATTATVTPTSLGTPQGVTAGAVSSLATSDQSGTQDNPASYVSMQTPTKPYIGRFDFTLPSGSGPKSVKTMAMRVNFSGPKRKAQAWTWMLYNWKTNGWVKVGSNSTSVGGQWTVLNFKVAAKRIPSVVNAAGQVRVRVKSGNAAADAKMDYLALVVTVAPTTQPPADGSGPTAVAGNWRQVWGDEFNGNSLDLTKWQPNWLGKNNTAITQNINSDEGQCFDPANVSVSGGAAQLKLIKKTCPSSAGRSAGMPYTGAAMTTQPHFTFKFGVVETRMWVNGSDSTRCNNWDSFWLNGLAVSTRKEYDVAECLGNRFAFHLNPGSTSGGSNGSRAISNGWHIFTIDWESTGATVYYDTTKIGTITKTPYKAPMYIIYENATHGTSNVVAPDVMKIDWVRVWQK